MLKLLKLATLCSVGKLNLSTANPKASIILNWPLNPGFKPSLLPNSALLRLQQLVPPLGKILDPHLGEHPLIDHLFNEDVYRKNKGDRRQKSI